MRKFLLVALLLQGTLLFAQMPGGMSIRGGSYTGQAQYAFISGTVVLSPETEGGEETPGNGVVVQVVSSLKDKKYCVAGEDGRFRIMGVKPGNAIVSFSMTGYKTLEKVVELVPGQNKMVANLQPDIEALEGAVIKEIVDPISVVGDTIVFKASAVKTQKGEMAIDILEQMPGVEVTDNGIKVMNEDVKNVYIDGALLFGDAPMKALQSLAADDVTTIKSYQEYANKDPNHKIRETENKERVLDVQTKSKLKSVIDANVLAGGGFDTDTTFHKFRYTVGGAFNSYSEKLQYSVQANLNNINDASTWRRGAAFDRGGMGGGSADLRSLTASANLTRKWMSPTTRNFVLGSLGGNYSLIDSYNVNESISKMIYFPSDQFETREVEKTKYDAQTKKSHIFGIYVSKSLTDGRINLNAGANISSSINDSYSTDINRQDNLAATGTRNSTLSESGAKSYNGDFTFEKGLGGKLRVVLSASGNISNNDSGKAKKDTLETTSTRQVIDIEGIGKSRRFSVVPTVNYYFNDFCTFSMQYNLSRDNSRSEQLAFDNTNPAAPLLDTVNTYTYTRSEMTQKIMASLTNYIEALNANLSISAGLKSVVLDKDETFPEADYYNRRFDAFVGTMNLVNKSSVDHWSFNYSLGSSTPSLEQVRPKIDNASLYSVSAGNPLIKHSSQHSLDASFSSIVGSGRATAKQMEEDYGTDASTFGAVRRGRSGAGRSSQSKDYNTLAFLTGFSMTTDPVVRRDIYYPTRTFLPEYNYTMPAQSTLSTYENAPNSYKANASVMYSMQIRKIMCIFNTSAGINWSSSPSYINRELTRTEDLNPSVFFSLRSNFSRKIRLFATAKAQYITSSNDRGDHTDYFMETLRFNWEVNSIFQKMYASGTYNTNFTQKLEYGKMDGDILNLRLGVRFGEKNNYDFSISANDVFNKQTGFSTSMNANYITNTWKHQFGRYVMATFAYRFNKGGNGGGAGRGGFGRF